jgi:hypothetical protein
MLGNDCKRYVAPNGKMYLAGTRYTVSAKERAELFSLHDENGVLYFYEAEFILRQLAAKRKKLQRQIRIEAGDEENTEIDTGAGAVHLTDDEGDDVGKRGDSVSV